MRKKQLAATSMLNYGSFPGKIFFSVGFTYEELRQQFKKQRLSEWVMALEQNKYLFDNNNWGFAQRQYWDDPKGNTICFDFLIIKEFFNMANPEDHLKLAHEIIHITTFGISERLDVVKENEAFAYTHSHIMGQVYDILLKKKQP